MVNSLNKQFDIFFEMFSRPVVQQQIVAALVVLLLSWLIPEGIRRRQQKKNRSTSDKISDKSSNDPKSISNVRWWLTSLHYLLAPILALLFLSITTRLFASDGYPNGLLIKLQNLIWIWLTYRLILALLYARFGDATRPYHVRILTPIFLILLVLQFLSVLPGSAGFVNEAIGFGMLSVTLGSLASALVVLYVFIIIAWISKQLMVYLLAGRLSADAGVIESVATLTRYAILSLGIVFFLSILGLDFTSLAIVAGGLSVGIGIGLQELVANFVSGLVLLFEQSLRPGDIVEVDGRISRVEKISLRATVVRTRTNEELIIPNSNFTTNQVKNFTKSDRVVQIIVPVGVSYKSDPEVVRKIAIETCLRHNLVLAAPPPQLMFRGYGDSSLDFDLVLSINRPELTLSIKSDLYYMLWKKLTDWNIEIPFPQRDLNLGLGWENLSLNLQQVEDAQEENAQAADAQTEHVQTKHEEKTGHALP